MNIPKEIYKYIEYELYHYTEYKKELQLERERILESSVGPPDGMPRVHKISNTTQNKALSMIEGTAILSLERRINAIDVTLKRLPKLHTWLFNEIYCRDRNDVYRMCDEIGISERTFQRMKSLIITSVGNELGVIKILA